MIQIDALKVNDNNTVVCNLYTDNRCVKILMTAQDYELLMRDGFFIRDGQTKDSANVINTSEVYELKKEDNAYRRKLR